MGSNVDRSRGLVVDYIEGDLRTLAAVKQPDVAWGYKVCKAGRAAHIRVWYGRPKNPAVFRLIRTFKRLHEQLLALHSRLKKKAPKQAQDVYLYARNTETRRKSLKNYTKGLLPILPEDAAEEEKQMYERAVQCHKVAKGELHVDVAELLKALKFPHADEWKGYTAKTYGAASTVAPPALR